MNATGLLVDQRPLVSISRPARGRPVHKRRAVLLAAGEWLAIASPRVRAELEYAVGLTRCSPITVTAHPPQLAAAALDEVTDVVDPMILEGSRYALQAIAAGSVPPWLWLFVAECDVLWPQLQSQALAGLS